MTDSDGEEFACRRNTPGVSVGVRVSRIASRYSGVSAKSRCSSISLSSVFFVVSSGAAAIRSRVGSRENIDQGDRRQETGDRKQGTTEGRDLPRPSQLNVSFAVYFLFLFPVSCLRSPVSCLLAV